MLSRFSLVLLCALCTWSLGQRADHDGWMDQAGSSDGLCHYGNSVECCWGWRRTDQSRCQPHCQQGCKHGECVGPDRCKCHSGYTGKTCNQDLNECGVKPRPCKHRCMNTLGSYKCYCLDGYAAHPDGSCRNARTCYHANCQYGCEVIKGAVRCTCPSPGLRLGPDRRTCVDIDECVSGGGVCPRRRKCVNTFGSFTCKCHLGFRLTYINGRYTCIDKDVRPFCSLNPSSPKCRCDAGTCSAVVTVDLEPQRPRSTRPPRATTTATTATAPATATPATTRAATPPPTPITTTTAWVTTATTAAVPETTTTTATSTTTAVTPPAVTPPAVTPPAVTPPAVTPPAVTPPVVTPPAVTPPAVTPPAVTPPAVTPPAVTPPAVTPPAVTPPAATETTTAAPHTATVSSTTPAATEPDTSAATSPTASATTTTSPSTTETTTTTITTTTTAITAPAPAASTPEQVMTLTVSSAPLQTTTVNNRINKEVTHRQRGDVHIPRHPGHNQVWEFDIELGNTAEDVADDPDVGVLRCGFDGGVCDWMSDGDGDLQWETAASPAGGRYLSVPELKAGQRSVRGARLAVQIFPPWSHGELCFSFSHWLTGHHVGVMQLFVKNRGRHQKYSPALWSRTGGHGWRNTQVTLTARSVDKVLLKAERRKGRRGLIAVDDVTLRQGACR